MGSAPFFVFYLFRKMLCDRGSSAPYSAGGRMNQELLSHKHFKHHFWSRLFWSRDDKQRLSPKMQQPRRFLLLVMVQHIRAAQRPFWTSRPFLSASNPAIRAPARETEQMLHKWERHRESWPCAERRMTKSKREDTHTNTHKAHEQ